MANGASYWLRSKTQVQQVAVAVEGVSLKVFSALSLCEQRSQASAK